MVLKIIYFSHLEILRSVQTRRGLYPFQVRRTENLNILTLTFSLGYLAIHLLGLSVGTIILPPFPSNFHRQQKMLINKRRNSDPAAAGGSNERPYYKVELFRTRSFFQGYGTWGPKGGVSRRVIKKNSFDDLIRSS